MATDPENDLGAFKRFIDEPLSRGEDRLTLDEALGRWEYETQREDEQEDAFQAIR